MITVLFIPILSALFGVAYAKNWFKAGTLSDIQRVVIRMTLAMAGFLSLHLGDLLKGESSFYEAGGVAIGAYCGVISSYVVAEKFGLKEKPVFADDESVLGALLKHSVSIAACQWLFVAEVLIYLLTILL